MRRSGFAAILILCLSAASYASGPGLEVWDALRSARPQRSGVQVSGAVLVRDAFTFRLESGAFFPLSEVSGRIVGGVFKGQGRFELQPATEGERRVLALRTRQRDLKVLSEAFDKAVFLFTDGAENGLLSSGQPVAGDENDLASVYQQPLKRVERDFHANLRLRLLTDLLEGTPVSGGVFMALVDCAKLPPAIAAFSPGGLDRLWFGNNNGTETTALYVMHDEKGGCWYSERHRAAPGSPGPATAGLDALHYSVETTLRKNTDVEGRTTLRFRCDGAGARVVPLDLFAKLRLSEVRFRKGEAQALPVPFIQGDDKSVDPVLVVLPGPLAPGEEAELTAEYRGDEVLVDAGENNYYVRARQNWYPDLNGFGDWAAYDLTYRIPKARQIVSVGKLVDTATDGDFKVYRFTSGQPVRAAGFNYGVFQMIERDDPDSGVKIRVYTNPGEPNFAMQLRALLPTVNFDTISMAEDTLADSINTARVGTAYFGPLAQNDVAVTQQTNWEFGQSWPSLIYIPYMAFLDWVTRMELGLYNSSEFAEQVTPHEFAHQWWGHRVGSATYRDYWIEEGLAEFTVSLLIEKSQGPDEFRKYWERARQTILEKPLHSVCANWEAGPISLGRRLATGETPQAYGAVVYRKGAFVIHMLRSLFRDPKSADRDHVFIDMLKDFIGTWAGRNPTTRDFQAVVERHAPAPYTGNLGWFFRQWVDGTALPKIESTFSVEAAGNGRYRIKGNMIQSGVPDDFMSIIPLYLEFEKGRLARFGQATITGNNALPLQGEIPLPKKPVRVVVNPFFELLTGR